MKNLKLNNLKQFLVILLVLSSCDSDDSKSDLVIEKVVPMDIDNNGNASDIYIRTEVSESNDSPYKFFIVKSASTTEIDIKFLKSLPSDRSASSSEDVALRPQVRLSENQVDTDGDMIQESTNYVVYVLNEGEKVLSEPSKTFQLTDAGPLAGKYTGVWNDNIYTGFGISAILSGSGDNYSGSFYYSNQNPSFTACCGGADDGSIFLELDGNSVTSFRYNQNLITYMGGCPGTYTGDGAIDGPITMLINFTGNDCDGTHTGGKIEFSRIE